MTALTADRMADYPWDVAAICFGCVGVVFLLHLADVLVMRWRNGGQR